MTGVELVLRLGGRITGRVVDASGVGLQGREVHMFGEAYGEATSDASGRFAFENLTAGQYNLLCNATAEEVAALAVPESQEVHSVLRRSATVELEERGSADVVLAPPVLRPVRLHGRLTGSGKPLVEASLTCSGEQHYTSAEADGEGAYELLLPSPGRYHVQVSSDRTGVQSSLEVDVPEVASFLLDVDIAIGAISGRVVGPDGRALAGVPVIAHSAADPGEGLSGGGEATTGSDGEFRLEVPEGTYDVVAGLRHAWAASASFLAPGRVRGVVVAPGREVAGLEIALVPGGSIAGRVRVEGGGAANDAWIKVVDGAGSQAGAARTDAIGAFRIDGLEPGRLRVQAFDQSERISGPVPVEIRVGETTRVELVLAEGTEVRARVTDANGAPIEVEEVALLDADGEVLQVAERDEQGVYQLGTVTKGDYVARARHAGGSTELPVHAAGEEELNVELRVE
jgi:hypothetical protein